MTLQTIPSFGVGDAKAFRSAIIEASRNGSAAIGDEFGEVFVLAHEAVRLGLTDRRLTGVGLSFFDASGVPEGELRDWYGRIMFTNEGKAHHRLRRLVGKAFTPKAVASLREEVAVFAQDRLEALREKGGGDLLYHLRDLPMQVMCSLLGVPKRDVGKFFEWVTDLSPVFGFMTPKQINMASAALHSLREYVAEMVEGCATCPSEDLISRLVQAEDEGDRLSRQETVDMVTNLLIAGQDTTLSQIGCSLYVLFKYAGGEQLSHNSEEKLSSIVDETIRMEGSIAAAPRTALEPFEVDGQVFDVGTIVMLTTYTANRDTAVWTEPDAFRSDRFLDAKTPKMMTFGGGAHFCLGAWLARLTLEEALRAVIAAKPRLVGDADDLEWMSATGANPVSIPVGFVE
jgi:cytochrome P450